MKMTKENGKCWRRKCMKMEKWKDYDEVKLKSTLNLFWKNQLKMFVNCIRCYLFSSATHVKTW